MNEQMDIWERLITAPRSSSLLNRAVGRMTCALSDLVGCSFHRGLPQVRTLPIDRLTFSLGDPEREMVGIYMQMYGAIRGQALFVLSPDGALSLAGRIS